MASSLTPVTNWSLDAPDIRVEETTIRHAISTLVQDGHLIARQLASAPVRRWGFTWSNADPDELYYAQYLFRLSVGGVAPFTFDVPFADPAEEIQVFIDAPDGTFRGLRPNGGRAEFAFQLVEDLW